MRVLFVAPNYAPSPSGADISAHALMSGLAARGMECRVLTGIRMKDRVQEAYGDQNFLAFQFCADGALEGVLDEINESDRPDVLMVQGYWLDRVLEWTRKNDVPAIWFVRVMEHHECSHDVDSSRPTWLVANSPLVADYIQNKWGRASVTLFPLVEREKFAGCATPAQGAVTMINPVSEKGGELFRELSLACPDRQFRAVRGWRQDPPLPELEPGADVRPGKACRRPHAKPSYIDLDLPNVVVDGPFQDMRPVYGSTRVLLVPSQWEEAFGRVVVEAMMNGIPTIVSNRGALPWVLGDAGAVVDATDVQAWKSALDAYDDPAVYDEVSRRALERAKLFDVDRLIDEFADRLRRGMSQGWPVV